MSEAVGQSPSVKSLLDAATVAGRRLYNFTAPTAAPTSTPDAVTPTTDGYFCGLCEKVVLWVVPTGTISYEVYRFNWVCQRWIRCITRSGVTEADEVKIETGNFIQRIYVRCTAGAGQVWGARSSGGGVQ